MNEEQLSKLSTLVGEEAANHIRFLQGTLIPDLIESGSTETAEDFQNCIGIIARLV